MLITQTLVFWFPVWSASQCPFLYLIKKKKDHHQSDGCTFVKNFQRGTLKAFVMVVFSVDQVTRTVCCVVGTLRFPFYVLE